MPSLFHRLSNRARPHARRATFAANRISGRFDTKVWLIGEGRSGTTWIANLINADGRMLERFEPFHPGKNKRVSAYRKLEYRRPGATDLVLESHLRDIFEARYWARWIDFEQSALVYDGLLIKDIFASLMAKWALGRMPGVKPVLLIRNPFSVARSKMEKQDWEWADDLPGFLSDADLMADHLEEQADILRQLDDRDDAFLNHLATWSIVHRVLFRQFARDEIHVVFYEDAVADTSRVASAIDAWIGRKPSAQRGVENGKASSISRVSQSENVQRARSDPYGSWRENLSEQHLETGRQILKSFGLDGLYGEAGRPCADAIRFRGE